MLLNAFDQNQYALGFIEMSHMVLADFTFRGKPITVETCQLDGFQYGWAVEYCYEGSEKDGRVIVVPITSVEGHGWKVIHYFSDDDKWDIESSNNQYDFGIIEDAVKVILNVSFCEKMDFDALVEESFEEVV